jgi:hypothetical protein
LSFVDQGHEAILILTSVSLLLLLLTYIFYRRRYTKLNETKLSGQRLEANLLNHEPFEYRLPTVRALPTIIEENPAILTPASSYNQFIPLSSPTSSG